MHEQEEDGPDLDAARRAYYEAQQAKVTTDSVVANAQREIGILRNTHRENHFVEKLRLAFRGAA